MSTAAEIKEAIDNLSPSEWEKLQAILRQSWDAPSSETPPGVHEKLAQAAAGRFVPGDRANIEKIHSSLE